MPEEYRAANPVVSGFDVDRRLDRVIRIAAVKNGELAAGRPGRGDQGPVVSDFPGADHLGPAGTVVHGVAIERGAVGVGERVGPASSPPKPPLSRTIHST